MNKSVAACVARGEILNAIGSTERLIAPCVTLALAIAVMGQVQHLLHYVAKRGNGIFDLILLYIRVIINS